MVFLPLGYAGKKSKPAAVGQALRTTLIVFLHVAGLFVTEGLTGMAAMAFINIDRYGLGIYYFIDLSRTGVCAFATAGTFLAVYGHFPHILPAPLFTENVLIEF